MGHTQCRPEQEAWRVLQEAKAEFVALEEPWDGYMVDVEMIATLLFAISVQRVPNLQANGRRYAAFLDAGAQLIAVEDEHHSHRQRFSIAHEVGHFVLHYLPQPTASGVFCCSNADMEVSTPTGETSRLLHQRREWEANLFAGELLMPQQAVLAMYRATGGRVADLAKHFKVSPKAMEIRLSRLHLPFAPRPI